MIVLLIYKKNVGANYPDCPEGGEFISGFTTNWNNTTFTYTMNFDSSIDATIMYNWLNIGITPTLQVPALTYPTMSRVAINIVHPSALTSCGDSSNEISINLPLGCYTTSADTAFVTITQPTINQVVIEYLVDPITISQQLCYGCLNNIALSVPTISYPNDFVKIKSDVLYYLKESVTTYGYLSHGLFSEECPIGARYVFAMTDNTYTDKDKWILASYNNAAQFCIDSNNVSVSSIGNVGYELDLTQNQIIAYGSTYTVSGDLTTDLGNINAMYPSFNLVIHPNARRFDDGCFGD